jgi:hypothetical protein
MSEYGHISWQYYVYGCYVITGLVLFFYGFFACRARKNALKNLSKEGFLETPNDV